jgi:glycosyltransferase involved in cell wall biosynthesis
MNVVIFSPTGTTLSPDSLTSRPLGGADQALMHMIFSLAHKPCSLVAYIPTKEVQELFPQVMIKPFMDAFTDGEQECDVLILYRKVFAIPPKIKYKKLIFYSQDLANTPCFNETKKKEFDTQLGMYNKIVVLSQFHKKNLIEAFDIPSEKFVIIGNGAEEQENVKKQPLTFIYASTPYRGLVPLVKIWRQFIKEYPQAKLHVFSSMKIYDAETLDHLEFYSLFETVKSMKGIVYHGSKLQSEVIDCMKQSYALLYPNTYEETYCNVVMEARACRTPFITSNRGALVETGGSAGLYLDGDPYSSEYQEKFIEHIRSIIENEVLYRQMQENCYPIRTWSDYSKEINQVIMGCCND